MTTSQLSGWERVAMGIEKVRARLLRAATVLNGIGVSYAVIGDNAVAEWVGRVDAGAVRFTKDVDVLIRRGDLPTIRTAMEAAGFVYLERNGVVMFLDDADATPNDAVHIVFSGEAVRTGSPDSAPTVDESEPAGQMRVISLAALVRLMLTLFRDKDRTHLRDLIDVGLIDATWPDRFSPVLATRLQNLLDHPE